MLFRKIIASTTIAVVFLVTGCASFTQNEVAEISEMPDVSHYKNKPSAFIDVAFYRGEPENTNSVEVTKVTEQIQPVIENVIEESELFSKVIFDEFKKSTMDYTIKIDVYNHGNEAAASISGFITGFTFGVIPGAATDNFIVKVQLIDKNGRVVKEEINKDSVTTWIGWIFLPMMGNTPEEAISSTLSNQVKAALKQLVDDGKLKYSLNSGYQIIYQS